MQIPENSRNEGNQDEIRSCPCSRGGSLPVRSLAHLRTITGTSSPLADLPRGHQVWSELVTRESGVRLCPRLRKEQLPSLRRPGWDDRYEPSLVPGKAR